MILKNSEKKENNKLHFTVESDAAEFEAAVQNAYRKNKGKIQIPGFRKGKAPMAVIEGMYGPEVFYQDALDDLCQSAFEAGLGEGENEIEFIGRPSIVMADVSEQRTAVYTFEVELYPEVELGQYKGIEVTKVPTEVSDEEVDAEIASVQKRNSRTVPVEGRAAQMGDTCNIDYEGFKEGVPFDGGKDQGFDLELGSNTFVPGFEDQLVGMEIGQEKDIDITFPENYAADLAGKAVVFHVKLNEIKFAELPELDDDFAQDVSEFDTFEEYKASVRKDLEGKKEEQSKATMRNEAILKACDNMKVEVPETMIRAHMEAIIRNFARNYGMDDSQMDIQTLVSMMGLDEETMNNAIRPNAVNEAKVELLVKAIVKAENIEATEEGMNEYVNKISGTVGATVDDIKKYFGMEYIESEYKKETAMDLVANSVVVVDAPAEAAEEKTEE